MKSRVCKERIRTGGLLYALLVLMFLMTSIATAAINTRHISSDDQLKAMIKDLAVIAEGRLGDNAIGGPKELLLGDDLENPAASEDFTWPNDVDIVLALTYDKESNTVYFRIGDKTLEFQPTKPFTDIFIYRLLAIISRFCTSYPFAWWNHFTDNIIEDYVRDDLVFNLIIPCILIDKIDAKVATSIR